MQHLRFALMGATLIFLAACGSGSGGGDDDPAAPVVELALANPAVFVGSFHEVDVRIDPESGLSREDLQFEVEGGASAGQVSLSREKDNVDDDVTLLVGPRPGSHHLVVRNADTGAELNRLAFESSTAWADGTNGPGVWFTGAVADQAAGSAWGGGAAGPQNINVAPAMGTRRCAIVFIDTETQRYGGGEYDAASAQWMDEAVNGVMEGGELLSVARYFNEVSYGNFTISAQAFGPYSLDGEFNDYVNFDVEDKADGSPKANFYQACITAADDDVNYNEFDTVICVTRSIDGSRAAWPYASISEWGPYTTEDGDKRLGVVSMPFNWDVLDGRDIRATLAHELGHNLGLGDMYNPGVIRPGGDPDNRRNIGHWGLMHADSNMPHISAAHRMRLGWIAPEWVRTFDFSSAPGVVDETVSLEAIANGAPVVGHSVVEVRIADGWNYYYEYRSPQAGQMGDQSLPRPSSVVGTDVTSLPAPFERPFILLLTDDSDGDGSVLQTGEDYRETDTTDPTFPTDFRVAVDGTQAGGASVRVQYGVNSRPDPAIRPWPAGPDRPYQSPDIEVRNDRNAADPELFNVPWANNPNTIVATIANRGNLVATDVQAQFYVKDFTVGGAPETLLGTVVETIPAGGSTEFFMPWRPASADGHYCVVVRIPNYLSPGTSPALELSPFNNEAQSNYDQFISGTASPATRAMTMVSVRNPYSQRTRVTLTAAQTNPWYRTFIEHRWVTLEPNEVRQIRVMFEHAGEFPARGEQQTGDPLGHNDALVRAYIENPTDDRIEAPLAYDGVQVRVVTGRRTQVELTASQGVVQGDARTVDNGEAVNGRAIVSFETETSPGREGHMVVNVNEGRFVAQVPPNAIRVHATLLGSYGFTESDASADMD